jgi:hypothetical protein
MSGLERLQRDFSAHIRDPENRPLPDGVEERRMKVYSELFFNNIQSLLASNFPVLRKLHDEAGWKALVRDFYANHHCRTPLFPEVSREFLRYLQDERGHREDDPPFLLELAHYEWIELALDLDERTAEDREANPDGDLLDGVPVLTPLLHVLSYRYPVHEIGPDYRPAEAPEEATHLLVYRDRSDRVKFMQLNGVSRLLLGYLQERSPGNGRELLERVAREINHPDPGKVVSAGADLLEDLRKRGILLGTLRTS